MLRFARTCDADCRDHQEIREDGPGRRLPAHPVFERSRNCSNLPLGTPIRCIRRDALCKSAERCCGASLGSFRERPEHELTEIYRKHGDAGSVAAEALPERTASCSLAHRGAASLFRDRSRSRPRGQGPPSASASGAIHPARSEVHREDHRRGSADRIERESGRRSHCARFRSASGASETRQHAAWRSRRDPAASLGRETCRGTPPPLPPDRLHAGQPGRILRGGSELFRERGG